MQSEYTEDDSEWEHLLSLKIFRESVCLVSTDHTLTLNVEEDAVKELETIDKEVNVVAITGLYRTGKSVLMNQLLGERRDMPIFGVGHATSAMTRGIWATCVRHPTFPDQVLMLLDTEGLGDIKKGNQNHDIKIFTMATLLSSTLIYNIMGTFNQDALEKLLFIARFSDDLALSRKSENEGKIIESGFPTFVLCLRDFFLNLQNDGEEVMTPKEYLEDCLQNKYTDRPSDDERFNKLREAIKKFFHRRYCFTFERPTASQDDLKKLDSTSSVTFTEEFAGDLKKLTGFIYKCKPKQMLNGSKTTGKSLASMTRTYVQSIRDGAIPSVGDAMVHVAGVRNRKLTENAMRSFRSKIDRIPLPEHDYSLLDAMYKLYQGEEIRMFKEEVIYDENESCLTSLTAQLQDAWQMVVLKNKNILLENCLRQLEKLHEPISRDVDRGIYAHNEGLKAYQDAIAIRNERFRNLPDIYGDQKPLATTRFDRMKSAERLKVQAGVLGATKQDKLEEDVVNIQKQVTEIKKQVDSDKAEVTLLKHQVADLNLTRKTELQKVNSTGHSPFHYFLTTIVSSTVIIIGWLLVNKS